MSPALDIRSMNPETVQQVVAVHEEAFPDFFLTELGGKFLRLYYRSLAEAPEGIGLVAVVEGGGVVGFAAGSTAPAGFYRTLLRRRWLLFAIAALPAVLRRPSRVGRVLSALRHPSRQPTQPGTAGLHSLASAPGAQGSGVGGALVEAFVREALDAGSNRVRLETDASGNDRVVEFYDRHGFAVVGEETRGDRRMLVMERTITNEG